MVHHICKKFDKTIEEYRMNNMDENTQDMLKQAYHYGWAHALEEVEKTLQNIRHSKKFELKEEYKLSFDLLLSGLAEELKNIAKDTKNK